MNCIIMYVIADRSCYNKYYSKKLENDYKL